MTFHKSIPMGAAALTLCCAVTAAFAVGAAVNATMNPQTRKNLETGMHDEAYVALKYRAYAKAARIHGDAELARLFEDTAALEEGHFMREAEAFHLDGGNLANLAESVAEEHYSSTKQYGAYGEQAEKADEHEVAKLFHRLALDEDDHYKTFMTAISKLTLNTAKAEKQ
jgi:rubrerythrin